MANQSPSPETVIRRAVAAALKYVRVALPGTITEYDPARLEATVQPAVYERVPTEDGTRATKRLPSIAHVPVHFMGGGGDRLTFPVKVGDTCEILFQSSSIDLWLALGTEGDPGDDRHHHITDAVAYVGLSDFAHVKAAHPTATVLQAADLRLGADDASDPVVRRSDLDAFVSEYHQHTHPAPGGATSAPTSTFTTPACSATVKTK